MTTTNPHEMTADEFFETITGFEEIAIASRFGAELTDLAQHKPLMFIRALVFAAEARGGDVQDHGQIKDQVLGMAIRDVQGYFVADDEVMPDDPETESGKDASRPAELLTT